MNVYIRPLDLSDASISRHWRNDPEIWKLTGSNPDKYITEQMERNWIVKALKDCYSIRFAICVINSDEYIGNVQLTSIKEESAELEIFIGNRAYWGRGVATSAIGLIVDYVIRKTHLKYLYAVVKRDNIGSIKAFKNNGFVFLPNTGNKLSVNLFLVFI